MILNSFKVTDEYHKVVIDVVDNDGELIGKIYYPEYSMPRATFDKYLDEYHSLTRKINEDGTYNDQKLKYCWITKIGNEGYAHGDNAIIRYLLKYFGDRGDMVVNTVRDEKNVITKLEINFKV